MSSPVVVDARGHACPVPTLKLMKAMRDALPGDRLVLLATDPMARVDAPHLTAQRGGRTLSVKEDAGVLTITVECGAPEPAPGVLAPGS
ncbi:sulfurtransferase TusA family protein [Brevundimonas sp. PAMC22021]|uniref:sulfurtransferase TusA family protein n=1 Tax=Brevundimonas sp. PAMC22021 TaxID=2861285 RepID=UPI001C62D993|nr:sulfurtransferase TusA family protein [Brevundimonas sp. PAMC22021]QYF87853.1 sulfurtransferase TusA family protein [Brevundimonas sp. PAMC22021]